MARFSPYQFKEQDAFDFARHVGIQTSRKGNNLHFKSCPYCRGTGRQNEKSFAIDLTTGTFHCLRDSCGVSGNIVTLSRDFDFSLGKEIDEYYIPKQKYRKLKTPKEPIVPKDPAIAYLESRKIPAWVATKYEITVQTGRDNILVFPFYDEKNILQFVKYRKTDFNKETDSNKEWCEAKCKPILFGMKQANEVDSDTLIFTEGQLDMLSVVTSGYENCVSVPTGSKGFTWIPYCWNWLQKFKRFIIFGDHEKGHITLLEDIAKRFRNISILHVREDDYLDCKDANEILIKRGVEQIKKCIENAVELPVKKVKNLAEVKSVNIYELGKVPTGITQLDKLLYGGLPFGIVALLGGKRGEGKTTFGSQLLINALEAGHNCFAYSGELPNYLFKAWIDFQIAGKNHITENINDFGTPNRFITNANQELINRWYDGKMYLYDSDFVEGDEKDCLLETIETVIQQYGVRVILIDNLMTAMYMDAIDGSDKYEKQGSFVRNLTKIAIRYDVLIILVAHRRKNNFSEDANDEISGSADITNLAGITLSYDRDKDLEQTQRKLIVAKNRIFGKTCFEGFILDFEEKSKRIYGYGDNPNREFGWIKGTDLGFEQINADIVFD